MSRVSRIAHLEVRAAAKQQPGVWVLANFYGSYQSGTSLARRISEGRFGYVPAGAYQAYSAHTDEGVAVWARYVKGLDVESLPRSMTVRVPDYGSGPGYEGGVTVREVEISRFCRCCGHPRGEPAAFTYRREGRYVTCDKWVNACGHTDEYSAVLVEAVRRRGRRPASARPEIRGVSGGLYREAVDIIAAELRERPQMRCSSALELLRGHGYQQAADEIATFVALSPTREYTSARACALYLIDLDQRALESASATTMTGDQS